MAWHCETSVFAVSCFDFASTIALFSGSMLDLEYMKICQLNGILMQKQVESTKIPWKENHRHPVASWKGMSVPRYLLTYFQFTSTLPPPLLFQYKTGPFKTMVPCINNCPNMIRYGKGKGIWNIWLVSPSLSWFPNDWCQEKNKLRCFLGVSGFRNRQRDG